MIRQTVREENLLRWQVLKNIYVVENPSIKWSIFNAMKNQTQKKLENFKYF